MPFENDCSGFVHINYMPLAPLALFTVDCHDDFIICYGKTFRLLVCDCVAYREKCKLFSILSIRKEVEIALKVGKTNHKHSLF